MNSMNLFDMQDPMVTLFHIVPYYMHYTHPVHFKRHIAPELQPDMVSWLETIDYCFER